MDALPSSRLPACHTPAHTTAGCTPAAMTDTLPSCLPPRITSATTRRFDGTLNLIFQPAEEGQGGAQRMVADGLFKRFPCDAVRRAAQRARRAARHFVVHEGPTLASADTVTITLTGKGAHGAMPQYGRDPVVAAAAIVMALRDHRRAQPVGH
ncbi:M20/M25/M40 family metallo-hydrolase [Cupriavidus basilensis]